MTFFADQRNLGMSMKTERSTLDQVKQRFELLKQKKSEEKKKYDLDKRLQELQEEVIDSCYIMTITLIIDISVNFFYVGRKK